MPEISDVFPTKFEAFNKDGLHMGTAEMMKSGRWVVTIYGITNESNARQVLKSHGGVDIVIGDIKK